MSDRTLLSISSSVGRANAECRAVRSREPRLAQHGLADTVKGFSRLFLGDQRGGDQMGPGPGGCCTHSTRKDAVGRSEDFLPIAGEDLHPQDPCQCPGEAAAVLSGRPQRYLSLATGIRESKMSFWFLQDAPFL